MSLLWILLLGIWFKRSASSNFGLRTIYWSAGDKIQCIVIFFLVPGPVCGISHCEICFFHQCVFLTFVRAAARSTLSCYAAARLIRESAHHTINFCTKSAFSRRRHHWWWWFLPLSLKEKNGQCAGNSVPFFSCCCSLINGNMYLLIVRSWDVRLIYNLMHCSVWARFIKQCCRPPFLATFLNLFLSELF